MRRRELQPERKYPVTEEVLINSGVPRKFWEASLSAIEGDPEYRRLILDYMEVIHEHVAEGHGLLLRGGYGSGKTSLAVVLLKEVIQRGGIAHFVQSRDLPAVYFDSATIDRSFDEPIVIRDRIAAANLVVIDDLGSEPFDTHGNAGVLIENVLRDRYNDIQTVIITTNCSMGELRARFTKGVVSLLSRITTAIDVDTDQWQKPEEE